MTTKTAKALRLGATALVLSILFLGGCGEEAPAPGPSLCAYASDFVDVTPDDLLDGENASIATFGGAIYLLNVDDPGYRWLVRRTTDGGTTWTTVDDQDDAQQFVAGALVPSPSGLVALGKSDAAAGYARRSDADGANWQDEDTYTTFAVYGGAGRGNLLFAVGRVDDEALVRRSTDGGANWTEADLFDNPSGTSLFENVTVAPDGQTVYAAGLSNGAGIVRRSTSQGAPGTWSTVDAPNGYVFDVLATARGVFAALGAGGKGVVRFSTDGDDWTTVDTQEADGTDLGVTDLVADTSGRILAAGYYDDGDGYRGRLRLGNADGTGWRTLGDYIPDGYDSARFTDGTVATNGDLYLAGYRILGSAYSTFVVKRACK